MNQSRSRQATLARVVGLTKPLLLRFVVGFDGANAARQAPGLPNHFAWNLGHLALTMHRIIEKLDGAPVPGADFVTGDGRGGGPDRFDTESVCFGSKPEDDPTLYPGPERARAIFEVAVDRLAARVAESTDAELDRVIAWGAGQSTWADLVARMAFHNGVHAGQIMDLRRALGMKGVLG